NLVRRGGEVVAPTDCRDAAQIPERVLQPAHERLERLRERDADPAPLAEAENELKQQVHEELPGDRHAELRRVCEVEGPLAARRVDLLEHDLLAGPMQRTPL